MHALRRSPFVSSVVVAGLTVAAAVIGLEPRPAWADPNTTDAIPTFSWLCNGSGNAYATAPSSAYIAANPSAGPDTLPSGTGSNCGNTAVAGQNPWTSPTGGTLPTGNGPSWVPGTSMPVSTASNDTGAGYNQQTAPAANVPVTTPASSPAPPTLSTNPEGTDSLSITGSVALTGTGSIGNGTTAGGSSSDATSDQTNSGSLTINGEYGWAGNGAAGDAGPLTIVGGGSDTVVTDNPTQPITPPTVPVDPGVPSPAPVTPAPVIPAPAPTPTPVSTSPAPDPTSCIVDGSSWGCSGTPAPVFGGGAGSSSWGAGGADPAPVFGSGGTDSSWGSTTATPVASVGGGGADSSWGVAASDPAPVFGSGGTDSSWGETGTPAPVFN